MTLQIGTLLRACLLALAACAGLTIYDPVPGQPDGLGDGEEEPVYQMDPLLSERQFRTQDGKKELARYSYRLCALSVSNMDVLSGEAAVEAARNVETFNARMTLLMEGYVEFGEAMGADAAEVVGAAAYYDEVCAEGFRAGEYISIRLDSVGYTGGAHPNRYASSCLFDLPARRRCCWRRRSCAGTESSSGRTMPTSSPAGTRGRLCSTGRGCMWCIPPMSWGPTLLARWSWF